MYPMNMTDKKSSTMLRLALGGFLGCVMLASPAYGQEEEPATPPPVVLDMDDVATCADGTTPVNNACAEGTGTIVTYSKTVPLDPPTPEVPGMPGVYTLQVMNAIDVNNDGDTDDDVDIPVGTYTVTGTVSTEPGETMLVTADTDDDDMTGQGGVDDGTTIPLILGDVLTETTAPTATMPEVTETMVTVGGTSVAAGAGALVKGENSVAV